jgi:hypothetical protein
MCIGGASHSLPLRIRPPAKSALHCRHGVRTPNKGSQRLPRRICTWRLQICQRPPEPVFSNYEYAFSQCQTFDTLGRFYAPVTAGLSRSRDKEFDGSKLSLPWERSLIQRASKLYRVPVFPMVPARAGLVLHHDGKRHAQSISCGSDARHSGLHKCPCQYQSKCMCIHVQRYQCHWRGRRWL